MQTGRKQTKEIVGQRERLSERTSLKDDATVRSASNMKMQKSAEMTDSRLNKTEQQLAICNREVRSGSGEGPCVRPFPRPYDQVMVKGAC